MQWRLMCAKMRRMQLWIHGDQTEATLEFDGNGNYSVDYTDAEGKVHHRGGGGVAYEPDGTERPLTEEELMEDLTAPEITYGEDGSVTVYWFDQKVDITDKFKNGVCYVKLVSGENTAYMTIKYENGYAMSPHRYPSPWSFN